MNTHQKDIFICHASEDKPNIVRPLYDRLESEGFDIWYDEAEIKWGDSITERVNWGLIHSRYVVVVLSESFLDKKWPNREFNSVVNKESSSGVVKVLPLLVGNDDSIKKIVEAYPLINDKRYLLWSDNQTDIVSELFKIFPEKKHLDSRDEKIDSDERFVDINELLKESTVVINRQVVKELSDESEKGVLVTPYSVNGFPFRKAIDCLSEKQKGTTLLSRFLDKAIWLSNFQSKASEYNLFIEIPALYPDTLLLQELLCALANDSGLDKKRLVILIPEPLITGNIEGNLRVTQSLKKLGIKIGVSKFGTGYSSLSFL